MRATRDRHRRGNTLVETVISLGVLSVLGSGVFGMLVDSEGIFESSLRNGKARRDTVASFEVLRNELRQASWASLSIDGSEDHGDVVTFQLPLTIDGTSVTWGAHRVESGRRVEYPDHAVRFRLVTAPEGRRNLVRQIVDPDGQPVGMDEKLAQDVDRTDDEGSKAFRVEAEGRLLALALRIRVEAETEEESGRLLRTHSSLLRVRNP